MASWTALLLSGALLGGGAKEAPTLFLRHCARCHGADGSGRGPGGERLPGIRLSDPRAFASRSEEELGALILRGAGAMPGFRAQLTEAEARGLAAGLKRPVRGRRGSPK